MSENAESVSDHAAAASRPRRVISTHVGLIGGENDNPTEENNFGHGEAVEVTFDPGRLSYRELLECFFMVHRADLGEDVDRPGLAHASAPPATN